MNWGAPKQKPIYYDPFHRDSQKGALSFWKHPHLSTLH